MSARESVAGVPTFACRCAGCRQMPGELYIGMPEYRVLEHCARMGSHYFAAETRRFFGARLLSWRVIGGGLIVIESKRAGFDPAAGREYVATLWCRFGALIERAGAISATRPHFATSRAARAWADSATAEDYARDLLAACTCHGCEIARAGGAA